MKYSIDWLKEQIAIGTEVKAQSPHTWRGTNWLGFALMEVRDKFLEDGKAIETHK